MHFCFRRESTVCLAIALAMATVSHALEPTTPLARLGRQSWSMENGLPQNTVPVLLQSRDGYLWAGTELGLARFDGVSFRIFDHATTAAFPDAEIRCLLDAADGGVWVGTGDGLVLWKDGRSTLLTAHDGLPSNSIRGLAQTTDGVVWIWTELGMARWNSHHVEQVKAENGLPGGGITSMAADGQQGLWVGTTHGAAVFRQGHWYVGLEAGGTTSGADASKRRAPTARVAAVSGGDVLIASADGVFQEHEGKLAAVLGNGELLEDGVSFLTRMADGTIVAASKSAVILARGGTQNGHAVSRFAVSKQLPGSRIESVFADREGCLWVGTNRGMARVSVGQGSATVQLLPPTDPLAANAVVSFLEDREGDLWVGTETAGLHILRDARFHVVGSSDGLSSDATTAIVEDTKGTFWIGTRESGLNRLAGGVTTSLTTANGLLSNVILALAATPKGDLWVGTPDGLNRVSTHGVSSFTSADGLPDDFIRSLLVAPDNSVWIGTRRGLTHLDHGRFENFTHANGLGNDLVGALARTGDGDLWIATLDGLTRLSQGKLQNYTTADGLSSNVIIALDVTADGMLWIGTRGDGLNLRDGKRFVPVHDGQSVPEAIHAVLHDDLGHLWIASGTGLTRADLQGLHDCAQGRPCRSNAVHFTTADGLRSRETSSNSHPTALRARDGQLWFTTPRGVVVVDPKHVAATPGPPPVAIERFAVDDQDEETTSRITAGHLRFQFDYAGLSFAAPQKLRYQYMLEGFDRTWTDAGTRRTAYYTNIPPGGYRFRVRATIGDSQAGLTEGASETALTFELLPHIYQTVWFRVLLGLLVAALVLLIFRRRVIRVERELRAVMRERNRIAREIHDTLAQGYVGISLQLEILGELLRHNRNDAAAKHLALTQGLVREGLNDARQSIWALRSQDSDEQTLPIRLRRLVEKAQERGLTADLEVHGAYRALAPGVEQEVLRIAQEAIQNVKRHAAASCMSVRLEYDEGALALSVTDDGRGFAQSDEEHAGNVVSKPAEGHYGMTGMKERAALIGGEIEIASEPGAGTAVRLLVPASESRTRNKDSSSELSGTKP
jgi:signal transduction histidine kinase/ligand-binding sensor domain-containing protein